MAAPQPTAPSAQPPPELPNMPEVSTTLSDYLRRLSLWCRSGFADKLSASTALPGVMLQASDAAPGTTPNVFMIQVSTAGAITATPVALGGGKP